MRSSGRRISLFLPSLRGGGAERVMLTIAAALAERSYEVDLVLVQRAGPYLADVPEHVRVVDLDVSRVSRSVLALSGYLRSSRPDALLSTMSHANVVALLANRIAGNVTRVVVREAVAPTPSFRAMGRSATGIILGSMRLTYPWAASIIAVSAGVAGDLSTRAGLERSRIRVIHNPVLRPELEKRRDMPVAHPWFAPGAPPVVLGVGRLTAQKDFDTLIRAFAIARESRPLRLMILGEGEERGALERRVRELGLEDDVALPGFFPNPYGLMHHAGLFVLSSAWEGLPNALIEALACGAPVVSTDCPSGPQEILEGGRCGRLVPIADAPAMATAILAALDDPETRERGVRRAGDFGLDSIIDSYEQALLG